jgi:hypothetical protein
MERGGELCTISGVRATAAIRNTAADDATDSAPNGNATTITATTTYSAPPNTESDTQANRNADCGANGSASSGTNRYASTSSAARAISYQQQDAEAVLLILEVRGRSHLAE